MSGAPLSKRCDPTSQEEGEAPHQSASTREQRHPFQGWVVIPQKPNYRLQCKPISQ